MPPGGIIKTPTNGRSKDAKTAERTNSGGKKLVQTRLPFKTLAPAASPVTAAETAGKKPKGTAEKSVVELPPIAVPHSEPRKRKLSYGSDQEAAAGAANDDGVDSMRRSNSKENLALDVTTTSANAVAAAKKLKTISATEAVVIELVDEDDDDDDDEDNAAASKLSNSTAKETPPPIQIKLPLISKRNKRRKSLKQVENPKPKAKKTKTSKLAEAEKNFSYSSDDIEEVAKQLNPQKRKKLAENVVPVVVVEDMELDSESADEIKGTAEVKAKTKSTDEAEPTDEVRVAIETEAKAAADIEAAVDINAVDTNGTSGTESEPACESAAKSNVKTAAVVLIDSSESDVQPDDDVELSNTDMDAETDTKPDKSSSDGVLSAATTGTSAGGDGKTPQKLTAKQLRLLEQRRKAREEKERKLNEERLKKQQEKEEREKAKKRERDQKEEQRRKEREEKEEQRRKEREEKELKRQAEVESKNEEKRKRNEAKEEVQRKKDEEKRRKEQEKEEAEQKKKRAAESFSKFFVQKQPLSSSCCDSNQVTNQTDKLAFQPFQIKDDMLLAPVIRAQLTEQERKQLDGLVHYSPDSNAEQDEAVVRCRRPARAQLYLGELHQGQRQPKHMKRHALLNRRPKDEDDDDVQVIDEFSAAATSIVPEQPKQRMRMRAKYLQFADNRRPPFYGTWRKRSKLVKARRPLALDKAYFDYEVDSDCEWEEEEPGESLSASEDEKERESEEEDYEVDNEWFVPHGHLSDEEMQNDGELEDGNTREAQQAKLQVMQQEFAQEMKKQTKKLKPLLLGPLWLDENGNKSALCPAVFTQIIDMHSCWQLAPISLEPPPELADDYVDEKSAPLVLDESLLQQLVRLIHGNSNAKAFLISEYLEYLKTQSTKSLPSKTLLREKFDEFATWKSVELNIAEPAGGSASKKTKKRKKRLCWLVHADVLQRFQLGDLPVQNSWNYVLTPKQNKLEGAAREDKDGANTDANGPPQLAENPSTPSTSKKLKANDKDSAKPSVKSAQPKKRIQPLMSVSRDQQFHVPTKNALISQYLTRQENESVSKGKSAASPPRVDDVVLLSD